MLKIKVILGSMRPNRFGIQPATWIMEQAKQFSDQATFELVDLKEIDLPFLDEPVPPSTAEEYAHNHTKEWAQVINDADGFIFVTSEYNHSFPASLKNAIDFLYKEWNYKPAAIVSYGADAGGARAVEHLRGVLSWQKVFHISEHLIIPEYYLNLDEQGAYKFSEAQQKKAHNMLKQLIFWTGEFKASRAKLQS
jgi:NAD(P)H-dependent FMN reductase